MLHRCMTPNYLSTIIMETEVFQSDKGTLYKQGREFFMKLRDGTRLPAEVQVELNGAPMKARLLILQQDQMLDIEITRDKVIVREAPILPPQEPPSRSPTMDDILRQASSTKGTFEAHFTAHGCDIKRKITEIELKKQEVEMRGRLDRMKLDMDEEVDKASQESTERLENLRATMNLQMLEIENTAEVEIMDGCKKVISNRIKNAESLKKQKEKNKTAAEQADLDLQTYTFQKESEFQQSKEHNKNLIDSLRNKHKTEEEMTRIEYQKALADQKDKAARAQAEEECKHKKEMLDRKLKFEKERRNAERIHHGEMEIKLQQYKQEQIDLDMSHVKTENKLDEEAKAAELAQAKLHEYQKRQILEQIEKARAQAQKEDEERKLLEYKNQLAKADNEKEEKDRREIFEMEQRYREEEGEGERERERAV